MTGERGGIEEKEGERLKENSAIFMQ